MLKHFIFLLLLFIFLPLTVEAKSNSISLSYERVIDGDTFVASGKKIRLWGIDAPEKNEPKSLASTLYLEDLLKQKNLTCLFKHKDRYKRYVMQCFSSGEDIARMMVRMGMARDYYRYSKGAYAKDELRAKNNLYGIWAK